MIYFASDFHLGIDLAHSSRQREQWVCEWLDSIREDAEHIYLLGDVFDFWFEYAKVIPRGYVRLLGKMASLSDSGTRITIFTGNHDMWMYDYFPSELGISVERKPIRMEVGGKKFLLGHGDGLGPGDKGYKRLKKIFSNPLCQWLFARLHPNFGFRLAQFWSTQSRASNRLETFLGAENEWLIQYCEQKLKSEEIDFFIFGHRHLPIDWTLSNQLSRYINLGDWMHHYSYACYDGNDMEVRFFRPELKDRLVINASSGLIRS